MIISPEQLTQIIDQAHTDAPNETCGIIAGKDQRALKIFRLPNDAPDPRVQYNAEPRALLEAFQELELRGWDHLAIYHSHPASPAYPSPTDIARAFYPDAIHIIVSLADPIQAVVRAFKIVNGIVNEVTLDIEEEQNESSRTNQRNSARRADRPHAHRAVAALSERRSKSRGTRGARR